jgi:uncharacterized protein YcbK (DUF882 family)
MHFLLSRRSGAAVEVVYRKGAAYDGEVLEKLEACLRDFRTGDRHPVDPRLYDLLTSLASSAGGQDGEFQIISGFRSPRTNEMLRATRKGARSIASTWKGRRPPPSWFQPVADVPHRDDVARLSRVGLDLLP